MPQHTLIIRRRNKFAHRGGPSHVYMNTAATGLKHELHLCYRCDKFRPKSPDNCPLAQAMHEKRMAEQVDDIRIMCPEFEPMESNSEFVREDLKAS